MKQAYNGLVVINACDFPHRGVWVNKVPTKVVFFAWEAAWGKILTLDKLQKRGWQFPNRCFLCVCEEESVNHSLLHCTVVRALWDIVFALVGVHWVFPELVKEALFSWRGPFVGKKRKKIWNSIPLCIFWMVWKERNRLAFNGGVLNIQKLKNSFACTLWSWGVYWRGVLFTLRFFGVASGHLREGKGACSLCFRFRLICILLVCLVAFAL